MRGFKAFITGVFRRFFKKQCPIHSAAIAYYAVFSFFPAMLILIIAASKAYGNSSPLVNEIINYINTLFPGSAEVIIKQIYALRENAKTFALVSALILLWSSASVFSTLDYVLNDIFDVKEFRTFIMSQLSGIIMMFLMYGLLLLSVIISFFLEIIKTSKGPVWFFSGGALNTAVGFLGKTNFLPLILIFVMFVILFRYLPRNRPSVKSAVLGALTVTLLWEISKKIFLWFIIKQAASYQLIYGSLASTISFVLWCYVLSIFTLFGACVAYESESITKKR